jgi:hypothetical protein
MLWNHPSVLDQIQANVILFKPEVCSQYSLSVYPEQPLSSLQVYPNLYNWTTYPLVTFLEQIYEQAENAVKHGKRPEPVWIEICCAAERALNYMHTGNTAVIATSVMNPLWIGRSIVKDGFPCFNPRIVAIRANSTITITDRKWPWDSTKHRPKSCSERCQVFTYNQNHYNVCITLLWCLLPQSKEVGICQPNIAVGNVSIRDPFWNFYIMFSCSGLLWSLIVMLIFGKTSQMEMFPSATCFGIFAS